MIVVFGLSNCDSCRKALTWLRNQQIEYHFVDYRKNVLEESTLSNWIKDVGWENILNRRSSTWRVLSSEKKRDLTADSAKTLMLEFPTLIKRPIIETGGRILINPGFLESPMSLLSIALQFMPIRLLRKKRRAYKLSLIHI